MKFKFVYESVLRHKKSLEQVARRAFAEAQHQVDLAAAELKKMYDAIDEARTRSVELEKGGGRQGNYLVQIDEFIEGQKIRIQAQRQKIRQLMETAEEKHESLIESVKECKILEKIKEKRFEEFKKALKKKEMKIVDEIVTTRFKVGDRI